jgi:protein-tyrosine phosphatase
MIAPRDFEDYDLILAADRSNLRDLRDVAPNEARARMHLLREFDPDSEGAPDLDVPDPYYGGPDGFERVLDLVEAACRGLLDELRAAGRL